MMQEKSLQELKQIYNEKLVRYNKMCDWLETASKEDQLKQQANVLEVVMETSRALNAVADKWQVTCEEIEQGFTVEGD